MATDVVLAALLGTWRCTWSNYPGARYVFVFAGDHRGLFENANTRRNVRNTERFAYRLEHIEHYRGGYIGELYRDETTRYLFMIYAGKLSLSDAEQFSPS